MRCARCGNDNPGTNRFCGMCGATLLRPPVRAPQSTAQSTAPPAPPISSAPAAAPPLPPAAAAPPLATAPLPPTTEETPVISGPSFLGLSESARQAEPRSKGSLSIDPSSAPSSRSLDYLLEEEHEHASGGAVKYVLILLALILAVGLGYLRFKGQGLAWLKGNTGKPPATQSSDGSDSPAAAPPASSSANPAPASGTTPPTTTAVTPSTTDSTGPSSAPVSSAAVPASATPAATPPAAAPTSADTAAPTDASANPAPANPALVNPAPKPAPKAPRAKDLSDPNATGLPVAKPRLAPSAPKPAAATTPATPLDPVVEAQNYIYGRGGVRQDCDRGLRILKPAADQSNPKALVEMGALYSAGLCTPRDLPTAYRWFALALRKDPDNQAVQTDLQKLWGEMTQPERQLAIKLSQ